MKESKFASYPEDVLKMLLELLKENISEVQYYIDQFDELYPQISNDLKGAIKLSATQIGDSNLEEIDYEYLLNLWGSNPNYTEGDTLNLPTLKKIVVVTRVDLKQYVTEDWKTTYITYLNESQLKFNLEDYGSHYYGGTMIDQDIRDSETREAIIEDMYEEPLTESKYKTKVIEEFDNKMNDISYLKKMKTIIENRINFLSKK